MNRLGSLSVIRRKVQACKTRCEQQGIPFHADALAAELGITYDTLLRFSQGENTVAVVLSAALQDCTASVLSHAMSGDQKYHAFYMWYLRNRGGFADKGAPTTADSGITFIGEGRI